MNKIKEEIEDNQHVRDSPRLDTPGRRSRQSKHSELQLSVSEEENIQDINSDKVKDFFNG